MQTKKNWNPVVAVLAGLSWALPSGSADTPPQASSYLPLAVGNSWTYHHEFYDIDRLFGERDQWPAFFAQESSEFTLRVERAEKIDGQTYYVFSEMPAQWPPAPPHFIAGKKLRWAGTHLMEHSGGREQAIFRFDGTGRSDYVESADFTATQDLYEAEYAIPTTEEDTRVTVSAVPEAGSPWYSFKFLGADLMDRTRHTHFLAGFGLDYCGWRILFGEDHPSFHKQNNRPSRGARGGRRWSMRTPWRPPRLRRRPPGAGSSRRKGAGDEPESGGLRDPAGPPAVGERGRGARVDENLGGGHGHDPVLHSGRGAGHLQGRHDAPVGGGDLPKDLGTGQRRTAVIPSIITHIISRR